MTTPKSITEKGVLALTALGRINDRIRGDEFTQAAWVDSCRAEGCSWRMIGVSLGVTTQAAWDRYSGHERDSEIRDVQLPFEGSDLSEESTPGEN